MASKPTYEELEQRLKKLEKETAESERAEEALRESEQRYRGLFENSTDFAYTLDLKGNFTNVNQAAEHLTGYTKAELIGMNYTAYMPSHSHRRVFGAFTRIFETEKPLQDYPIEVTVKDGSKKYFETSASLLWEGGKIVGFQGSSRDITERKLAEDALRGREEQYRDLFENANDLVQSVATDGRFLRVNKKWRETLGYGQEELSDLSIWDVIQSESVARCKEIFQKVISGEPVGLIEVVFVSKDGKLVWVEGNVNCRFEDGRPASTRGIFRDISERKRAEEETRKLRSRLERAQRLEAIGTLAGGIAHDFNNLLMGIQGNASLMLVDMDSTHPQYERLKNVEKLVQSGARLTSHLLGYARKGKYDVKPIDLNHLVKQTSETFGRTRKEITIHQELAEDLFSMQADHAQIEQVLLNLFVNAADAMVGGGDLTLKTMNVTAKNMKDKLYDPKPGDYVLLTVTDNGMGMDKKTAERIFDPFFTTKEIGRGTGLGLASAYGIIKGHGGYVDVESIKGEGTTFSIYFPASGKAVHEDVKRAEPAIEGAGTVLLVDDEEVILEVGRDLLEALGYRVLPAQNGKEAIEAYKKNHSEIDIVVLDMVMPNVGGGAVYDCIREINPGVKVLLSSGYSIDGEATEILARGCNGFIQKPFSMEEVSAAIEKILQREQDLQPESF